MIKYCNRGERGRIVWDGRFFSIFFFFFGGGGGGGWGWGWVSGQTIVLTDWNRGYLIMLNMEPNFLRIYLTNPYDFMLEILFRKNFFFWYMKILLRSFSFWDIENVKPKFQPRCAYKLYAYKKWSVWNVKKGNWLLWKLIFETFLPNLFSSLLPIRKNNFRKAFFQFAKINSAKLPEN